MIGQFVAAERATLRRKSVFPIAAREPITPNDPESAKGLHDQAQVVEGRIASTPESTSEAIKPAACSLSLDPIAELQRNAVRGGKGAAEQAEVVITGHGQVPFASEPSVGPSTSAPLRFRRMITNLAMAFAALCPVCREAAEGNRYPSTLESRTARCANGFGV